MNRTVGITLLKSITYDSGELKRICHDSTIAGLEVMYEADTVKPFRFLYMSGYGSERDQTKRSHFQPEYPLIRVGLCRFEGADVS
jgi:hypothetical protein